MNMSMLPPLGHNVPLPPGSVQAIPSVAPSGYSYGGVTGKKVTDLKDDDLFELLILANKNLKKDGIKMIFQKHPAAEAEPQVKKLIGYYPSGEMQIIFEKDKKRISCIRGFASFGQYELMGVSEISTGGPQRFGDPRDVVVWIRKAFNIDLKTKT